MTDIVDRARTAVTERAELPGMSLLEHLEELRKRIIHSGVYLIIAFFVAYGFREKLFGFMEKPIVTALKAHNLDPHLVYLNPVDPFNFFIKISLVGGAILASPFILYQVWLFISPGLYRQEKRYILPFMTATVGLFLTGAFFGYHYVYPGALNFLIGYGSQFRPMVTLGEYTELFMTVILGLGITFELPILVFFLALFGIVSAGLLWRNIRYAILHHLHHRRDHHPHSRCTDHVRFCRTHADPLPGGYRGRLHGPSDAEKPAQAEVMNPLLRFSRSLPAALLFCIMSGVAMAQALPRFDGDRALAYTREFVATGPRWVGSKGHAKAQAFLERQFAKDDLVKDSFTASTPVGPLAMTNYIVKFPGTKDGVIVLASHYDSNYPLKDTGVRGRKRRRLQHGFVAGTGQQLPRQKAGWI